MTHRMQDDELDLDPQLVRGLLADQVPHLAHLPVELGDAFAVRMPRIAWAAGVPEQEATWLPRLHGRLPVTTPALVAAGRPGRGYPVVVDGGETTGTATPRSRPTPGM